MTWIRTHLKYQVSTVLSLPFPQPSLSTKKPEMTLKYSSMVQINKSHFNRFYMIRAILCILKTYKK
ncbi:MAG: hypothetical protein O7F74_02160, partial [Bacteroidetes bacterium]|nr:hypothetical protein [Bacteroidota bacterium]